MTVTVQQFGGPRRLRLDPRRRYMFLAELARVKKRFPARKGVPYLMAPDCHITISDKGKKKHYSLYGRAILRDEKTDKRWQFYFGVLLLEWLWL